MQDAQDRLATFEHPGKTYTLQYPAHWEFLVQEEGRSCGFGPRDRDDVGIWITILPVRVETALPRDSLRQIFEQAVGAGYVKNIREDPSLHHHGLKGDGADESTAGQFWLIAGGDVVVLASSQLPAAERDTWTPPLDHLMASLTITR